MEYDPLDFESSHQYAKIKQIFQATLLGIV